VWPSGVFPEPVENNFWRRSRNTFGSAGRTSPTRRKRRFRDLLEHLGTPEDIAAEAGVGWAGASFAWLSRSRVLLIVGAVVVGLAIALPLALLPQPRTHTGSSSVVTTTTIVARTTVVVPNVLGLNQASAVAVLQQLGLGASVQSALSNGTRGVVVSQQPAVGSRVASGSLVQVWVSQ
jgi:hypothetical protein